MRKYENVAVEQLIPYARNARTHSDAQIKKLQSSIREFGFINPVLIDGNYNIIAGHGRVQAAEKEGLKEVPCIFVEDLTESQKKAYILADNRLSLDADWDMDLLKIELEDLQGMDFDLDLTGFNMDEIDALLSNEDDEEKEIEEDDFDSSEMEDESYVPFTKRGQVWQLGRHRLMCGDSTSGEDVKLLMDGQKADLIVTDPPYNVDYTGKTKDALKIQNDKMDNNSFYQFLFDVYSLYYEHANDGAGIYVFHADSEGMNFRKAMVDAGFKLAQCCVWVKQTLVMGRQDYHWKHEPVLYGWKPTGPHNWYTDRKQTTVWNFDRPSRNDLHPTMKPIPLIAYPIENSSKKNDLVIDFFGGSGSTLMACEQTGRINHSMELDERYCDVIIKRWEEFTGEKAVLVHGGL